MKIQRKPLPTRTPDSIISSRSAQPLAREYRLAMNVIQTHYSETLNGRRLTNKEVFDEVVNLLRRHKEGTLDAMYQPLFHKVAAAIGEDNMEAIAKS